MCRLGWCEIQNPGSDLDEVEIMRKLIDAGKVKLRIYNGVSGPGEPADKLLAEGPIDRRIDRFTQRTIKFYADGALGSRGAALLEKYSDADTSGYLISNTEETCCPLFEKALRARHSNRRRTRSATARTASCSIFTRRPSSAFRLTNAK